MGGDVEEPFKHASWLDLTDALHSVHHFKTDYRKIDFLYQIFVFSNPKIEENVM
jgi:hypothetical protein